MKPNTKYQQVFAARHRAAGRTQRKVWAHPDDWPQILKLVTKLAKQRKLIREITE